MIVVMQGSSAAEDVQQVIERMVELGFNVHRTTGVDQIILAGVAVRVTLMWPSLVCCLGCMRRTASLRRTSWRGGAFGRRGRGLRFRTASWWAASRWTMMAGPCSVESREQILTSAKLAAKAGCQFLRGGAFKPRSSPYSFQGMGLEGLKLLREVTDETGLLVITEVMEISQIELMLPYIDCFQVGARNMQNFNLLRELGHVRKPVLMKRGIAATIEEVLLSAEYILSGGKL